MNRLLVERAGPLTTVQDDGRPGLAHLGVPRAGPLDRPAAGLARRLVGAEPGAALLELTLGGLVVHAERDCWMALTGAPAPLLVGGERRAHARAEWVPAGARVEVSTPATGVRSYLALDGGLEPEPVLGSRSTDTLAWVGPPRVVDGAVLPLGPARGRPVPHDTPRPTAPGPLRLRPGPRATWFGDDVEAVLANLAARRWTAGPESDRVGLRLVGRPLVRTEAHRDRELPSEGMVLGAVQVPPSGQPIVFLADHPPTGGYPVVAVVEPADLWRCAQLRPGEAVALRAHR